MSLETIAGTLPVGANESTSEDIIQEACEVKTQPQEIFGAIMIALVVIGLFGNTLVCFTIMILQEYKKSVTNWYILQLALADTLFLLMLPFTAHSEIVGSWQFSVGLCKFKEAVIFINYYASIYFLVIMSFDRYLSVTKAFTAQRWVTSLRSPEASYIFSSFGWFLSVILCIQLLQYSTISQCGLCEYRFPGDKMPYIFAGAAKSNNTQKVSSVPINESAATEDDQYMNYGGHSQETLLKIFLTYTGRHPKDVLGNGSQLRNTSKNLENLTNFTGGRYEKEMCKLPNVAELHVWIYGNFFGAFVLPLILISFFYGKIVSTIMKTTAIREENNKRSYRRRVTVIVLALVTLFVISWLPFYLEKLVKIGGVSLSPKDCHTISLVARGIAYLNSAFNPYFYSFLGFHFRDRLKRAGNRIRVISSLRSKTTLTASIRRRRRNSSENSGGSNRVHANPSRRIYDFNGQPEFSQRDDFKNSPAQTLERTERTTIGL